MGARGLPVFLLCLSLLLSVSIVVNRVAAAEILFLQDGRTIQAESTEIIGDRIRIEKPAETIDLPRSDVLSIHQVSPPSISSNPPPAEVYRSITQQMVEKVRGDIRTQQGASRVK